MFNLPERKNIFIWGTGYNCSIFFSKLEAYLSAGIQVFFDAWKNGFRGFIDIAEEKIGGSYRDMAVVAPDIAISKMDYCIITVSDCRSIIDYLEENGLDNGQWIFWTDFLKECKTVVMASEEEKRIRLRGKIGLYNSILNDYGNNNTNGISQSDKIAALEWRFEDDIEGALRFHKDWQNVSFENKTHKIKTIGIIIDRLYGGGIEKVIFLLTKGFTSNGYKLVLLVDEDGDVEDDDVKKIVFKNRGGFFIQSRLKDIERAVMHYNIDIMCFHSGYARLDAFYEVLLCKILDVYVAMTIHSAFIALLKDQIGISSRFVNTYKEADRIIAVSKTDAWFWNCMGCNTSLIENPIESFGIESKSQRVAKEGWFDVIWIGRIVERPKRVLDAIKIIKSVHKKKENVRLRIVGMKDDAKAYNLVKEETKGLDYVTIEDFRTEIGDVYNEADIVLLTSASESFSNVLGEAKVFARPVVMYELPWLRLAKPNTGVWSVKQRDIEGAADAIVTLLDDEGLWNKYSDEAWAYIQSDIRRNVVDDWMILFKEIENDTFYSETDDEAEMVVNLLLAQMYDRGYPDYSMNEAQY